MLYLTACVAGLFVFDDKNNLVKYKIFSKNPKEIAEKLEKVDSNQDFSELTEIKKDLGQIVTKEPNQATEYLRENLREIIFKHNFVNNDSDLNKLMTEVQIERAKMKISKLERRDKLIIQSVSALNDLEKILNIMSERLREWYGLHYPELNINDHEKFAKIIAETGHREKYENFKRSMGMEFKGEDLETVQLYARNLKGLYEMKKSLEKYLERTVPEELPNLNAMLGSILAARLLATAGSLEKMAKMPSSTIQLMGAEKALFRFLKERKEGKPPRFGILYLHPDISTARRELQGKIARLLASKLTLAARADFYTKQNISKELLENYRKKLEEIRREKVERRES